MPQSGVLDKPYTKEELASFRKTFTTMKSYKDGTIHNSEHIIFLNKIGIPTTEEQVEVYKSMFRIRRGDELIGIEALMKMIESLHDAVALTLVIANFFDKDGDGIISEEEWIVGMKVLVSFDPVQYGEKGSVSFEKFFAEADTNNDGMIQVEELAAWLAKK